MTTCACLMVENHIVGLKDIIEEISHGPTIMDDYIQSWVYATNLYWK